MYVRISQCTHSDVTITVLCCCARHVLVKNEMCVCLSCVSMKHCRSHKLPIGGVHMYVCTAEQHTHRWVPTTGGPMLQALGHCTDCIIQVCVWASYICTYIRMYVCTYLLQTGVVLGQGLWVVHIRPHSIKKYINLQMWRKENTHTYMVHTVRTLRVLLLASLKKQLVLEQIYD